MVDLKKKICDTEEVIDSDRKDTWSNIFLKFRVNKAGIDRKHGKEKIKLAVLNIKTMYIRG